MKLRYKYFGSGAILLALMLLGSVAYMLSSYLTRGVFMLLCEELPEIFSSKSEIADPDGYRVQSGVMLLFDLFLSLLPINYLSLRLDNKRYERIISLTDGRYTMKRGLSVYLSEFALSDALVPLVLVPLVSLPLLPIPRGTLLFDIVELPLRLGYLSLDRFGIVKGLFVLYAVTVLTRLVAATLALNRWRAAWLCAER